MSEKPYAVKIYCPISEIEEYVFFYPVERDGEWYVSFNGCDHNWHSCDECEACRKKAYNKLINTDN